MISATIFLQEDFCAQLFFYRLSWAFFSKGPPNSSTRSAASGGKYNIIIQASPLEGFSENFTTPSTGCLPFQCNQKCWILTKKNLSSTCCFMYTCIYIYIHTYTHTNTYGYTLYIRFGSSRHQRRVVPLGSVTLARFSRAPILLIWAASLCRLR